LANFTASSFDFIAEAAPFNSFVDSLSNFSFENASRLEFLAKFSLNAFPSFNLLEEMLI
jgi:hypothetical protein